MGRGRRRVRRRQYLRRRACVVSHITDCQVQGAAESRIHGCAAAYTVWESGKRKAARDDRMTIEPTVGRAGRDKLPVMTQEERSERSRTQILDAALKLFSHRGYG